MITCYDRQGKDGKPDPQHAANLFRKYFFNRTDTVAFLAPWKKPCPAETNGNLEALLQAHVKKGPTPVSIHWRTSKGNEGDAQGYFRIGTYSPGPDGKTKYGCIDCDGGGYH